MDTDVVIAGGGPTGLMLACELRLAGVEVTVVERVVQRGTESRAGGLHSRTMEVLDQRGLADQVLAVPETRSMPNSHFAGLWMDVSDFPTRFPGQVLLLQHRVERILAERAEATGVRLCRGVEVTGLTTHKEAVEVSTRDGSVVRARYLVGCDGGRGLVRELAGIAFPGTAATMTGTLGDVELDDPPVEWIFLRRVEQGDYSVLPLEPGWYRVMVSDHHRVAPRDESVTLESLRADVIRMAGTDFGMRSPRWLSRFTDTARLAERYRVGRVLLAGDAAHIHLPAGGQGLNVGIQDAVNLGWKLGAVVRGRAPESLLDTYELERRPVAAAVLRNTRAQTALLRPGPHTDALREMFGGLLADDQTREGIGCLINGLDIRYPVDDGDDPLLGRRMPDVDLETDNGTTRVAELLRTGRPLFLDLGAGLSTIDHRVDVVSAKVTDTEWCLPVVGSVPVPEAVLIRPDGHIAWTPSATHSSAEAVTRWFGS